MTDEDPRVKFRIMRTVLFVSIVITVLKFAAWNLTRSNAVLTDALESIINVIAGIFALVSIHYASRPKDHDHPYGHGKIEYLSAGFEGGLIFISGILIIAKAFLALFQPSEIGHLDKGLCILALTSAGNCILGLYVLRQGKMHRSALMLADGKHLLTDTLSGAGLIIGLLLIYLTGKAWLDSVIAILYGGVILRMGYILLKSSINSLLDEADYEKLGQLVGLLNSRRRDKWIDIHNLRVLKYGSHLHVDCHLTLPWYDSLEKSHSEVSALEELIKDELHGEIEFFIHSDPCLPSSCPICSLENCKVRQQPFVKKLEWTMENMLPDKKHRLENQ
jgi:cation diffusion facilitator family transporter